MACPGDLGIGSNRSLGHRFGDVSINDGTKAHLGDSYHVKVDDALHHLPCAKDAPFNAYSKQHEYDCHSGTRVELLREIYRCAARCLSVLQRHSVAMEHNRSGLHSILREFIKSYQESSILAGLKTGRYSI